MIEIDDTTWLVEFSFMVYETSFVENVCKVKGITLSDIPWLTARKENDRCVHDFME